MKTLNLVPVLGLISMGFSLALTFSACSTQYGLHIIYTIGGSSVHSIRPCIGLIDTKTGVIQAPIVCEADINQTPAELPGGVMDVKILLNESPMDNWGADKINYSGEYSIRPYIQADGVLYASQNFEFKAPNESPDGAWQLAATFELNSASVVESEVALQSVPAQFQ